MKYLRIVLLASLVWGCSDDSSPSQPVGSDDNKPAVDSLPTAKVNYEAAFRNLKSICAFKDDFFVVQNATCTAGSFPSGLSQQISLIETTLLPLLEDYLYAATQADLPTSNLQREKSYFVDMLAKLKVLQVSTGVELAAKAEEIRQAEAAFRLLASELNTLGCDIKEQTFSCPTPPSLSVENTAQLIDLQHKIFQAYQVLQKIDSIYASLKNANIEAYHLNKIKTSTAKIDNRQWVRAIVAAHAKIIQDLNLAIEQKAETYFEIFEMLDDEQILLFLALADKDTLNTDDLKFVSEIQKSLQLIMDFLTTEENLIRSKLVNKLEIGFDFKFSKYDKSAYDAFPGAGAFEVTMPSNASPLAWVKHFKSLDDIANNQLLVDRDYKIQEIDTLIAKLETLKLKNSFPVFIELPLDVLKHKGVTETLEFYRMIEDVVFNYFPTFLNPKLYSDLTGQEQIKIVYAEQYSSFPPTTKDVLMIKLTDIDLFAGPLQIKIGIYSQFSDWLPPLNLK